MKKKLQLLRFICPLSTTCGVFDTLIKKLEETKLCITDVYGKVGKFKAKMLQRKEDSFFWIPDQAADGKTTVSTEINAAKGLSEVL